MGPPGLQARVKSLCSDCDDAEAGKLREVLTALGTVLTPLASFHQARKREMQAQGRAAGRESRTLRQLVLPREPQARTAVLVNQILYLRDPRSCFRLLEKLA